MPGPVYVNALGALVEIDLSLIDEGLSDQLRESWAGDLLPDPGAADLRVQAAAYADLCSLGDTLAMDVLNAAIDHRRGEIWMLHAVAVADMRGHVAVLCSAPGVEIPYGALHLNSRYSLLSTSVVGIDREGGVVGFSPRMTTPGIASPDQARRDLQPPDGSGALQDAFRLSKLVILEARDDAPASPRVEVLSTVDVMTVLVPLSTGLGDWPTPLRTIESLLKSTAGAARVTFRETGSLGGAFEEFFEAPSSPIAMRPWVLGGAPAVGRPRRVGEPPNEFFHGAAIDVLSLSERELLILLRSESELQLRLLDEVGAAIWTAAQGARHDDVVRAVIAQVLGASVDATEGTVADTLSSFVESELLSYQPVWRAGENAAWVSSTLKTTVLDLSAGHPQPIVLEASGHVIWRYLAEHGPMKQQALIDIVADHYAVGPHEIGSDVIQLLHDLLDARLAFLT